MTLHVAYLDPGTGSLFIQAVIGAVVGGAFVFRNFLARVVGKVRGVFGKRSKATLASNDQSE